MMIAMLIDQDLFQFELSEVGPDADNDTIEEAIINKFPEYFEEPTNLPFWFDIIIEEVNGEIVTCLHGSHGNAHKCSPPDIEGDGTGSYYVHKDLANGQDS
jgi:hypothetical protein